MGAARTGVRFRLAWPRPASDSVDNQEAFLGEALLPRQGTGHGIASVGRLARALWRTSVILPISNVSTDFSL